MHLQHTRLSVRDIIQPPAHHGHPGAHSSHHVLELVEENRHTLVNVVVVVLIIIVVVLVLPVVVAVGHVHDQLKHQDDGAQ